MNKRRGPAARWLAVAVPALLLAVSGAPTTSVARDRDPRFVVGLGDQIAGATTTPMFDRAPVGMITSWYNGRSDLKWMSGYQSTDTMSDWYAKGYALELVVWLANDPSYATSDQFQDDIELLTKIFRGNGPHYGPLYIVLFTEFETYSKDPAYRDSLRRSYDEAVERIHDAYGKAKVGLGFGGYGWLRTETRDLWWWESSIEKSDFVAAQHMHHCSHVDLMETQLPRAIAQLGSYGKPVFVSHFKFWGEETCQREAFARFLDDVFTRPTLARFHRQGLRAWGFMNDAYIRGDRDTNPLFAKTASLLTRFGRHRRPLVCPGFEDDPRNQVVGTPRSDVLAGTGRSDVICAFGGDDRIEARGGADLLLGRAGADRLAGNRGRDLLRGGPGRDVLLGGPGRDRCGGGPGRDRRCE